MHALRSTRIAQRLLFLAVFCLPLAPGSSNDRDFETRLQHDLEIFESGKTGVAAGALQALLREAVSSHDIRAEAGAHLALGQVALRRARYREGQAEADQALKLFESISDPRGSGQAERLSGQLAYEQEDKEAANALFSKALPNLEAFPEDKALTLLGLADASGQFSGETKARDLEALAIAQKLGNRWLECEAHLKLAKFYYFVGNADAALTEYKVTEKMASAAHNSIQLMKALTGQAILEIDNGRTAEALTACTRISELAAESEDRYSMIDVLNQQGNAYIVEQRFHTASTYFERALEQARKFGVTSLIDELQNNLANCLVEEHDYRGAIALLETAAKQQTYKGASEYRYMILAQSHLELHQYESALDAAQRAIQTAQASNNRTLLPYLLHLKAHVEDETGRNAAALEDARAAMQSIEDLRAQLAPDDFMKRGFADTTQETYGEMIGLLQKDGRDGEALELSERARARALLDLLASRDGQDDAHAAANPLTLEEMTGVAKRLRATILSYWVETTATYIWVLTPSGELHSARVAVAAAQVSQQVRALWPFHEATTRGGANKELRTRGGAYLQMDSLHRAGWPKLYQLLIRPVQRWLPQGSDQRLMIIGHGPLFLLPFASLQDERGRYLLERYALAYAPSVSMLPFTNKLAADARSRSPQYLLVADPSPLTPLAGETRLPPLPAARREVAGIASLLSRRKVVLLEGTKARADTVAGMSNGSTVIHLATHAIAQQEESLSSELILAPGKDGEFRNGRLTARAIYRLKLHSDLVFLSACRSGAGQLSSDGVLGLTRAFLYAGAASVIVSVWDVADEPTARLVVSFYRNWLEGEDKATALRHAELELLHDLRAGRVKIESGPGSFLLPEDPVFWASFTLQGEP